MYQHPSSGNFFIGGERMTGAATERKGKGRQRLRWYVFGPLVGAAVYPAFSMRSGPQAQ